MVSTFVASNQHHVVESGLTWSLRSFRPTPQHEPGFSNGLSDPRIRDADKLAKYLGLTYAIRTELGIRTIGSCDVSPRVRKRIQQQKRRKARLRHDVVLLEISPLRCSLATSCLAPIACRLIDFCHRD
jgi:hypothetical protein